MKKILVTFLCAAMLVAVAGMFACDISGDGTPHTHEYMQVAGERFLKSPATCTESAVYYYSCKCGEKAAETFTYGSPLGHALLNNNESFGEISPESTSIKYGTKITAVATEFLGCEFIGWYNGESMLTKEQQYTFNIECDITAKFSPHSEISAFIFETGKDTCIITGIVDKSVTKIIVPDYVTEIHGGAFSGCSYLQEITLPFVGNRANVKKTDIIQYPFGYIFGEKQYTNSTKTEQYYYGPSTNSSVTITSIFYVPSSLKSVTITHKNLPYYGAFSNCSKLESISLPNDLLSINDGTFSGCSGLTNITIPESVTTIDHYAFKNCTSLSSITIPDSVEELYSDTFDGCTKLITRTDDINYVDNWCLGSRYTSKGRIRILAGTRGIANLAFDGFKSAKEARIPNSVKRIGTWAFSDCGSLTSISIPGSVISIGQGAFRSCALTSITIGYGTTTIGPAAFYGCHNLTNISLPSSVETIGESAFGGTTWYDEQSGLIYIGNILYKYKGTMSSGKSITIKEGTKSITGDAFYECTGLSSVTIPGSVTSIGSRVFGGCKNLTSINVSPENTTYYSVGDCLIERKSGTIIAGCKNSVIPDDGSIKAIDVFAFSGCSDLTNITIPDSVASIGNYAFYQCSGLSSITIPNSVTSIGSFTFSSCTGLTSVTLPDSIMSIDSFAFSDCTSLTSITIPKNVTTIGDSAFRNCTSLSSITIPDSVKSIGRYIFDACNSLKTIFYTGNEEQWNNILICSYNNNLQSATRYYYSETEPALNADGTAYISNYWHYDTDGKTPVIWKKEK